MIGCVCVVGDAPLITAVFVGGNSAHVLIPLLSASQHKVNLLTRRPEAWSKTVACQLQSPSKKRVMIDYGNVKHPAADILHVVKGEINKKSSDPADVIPEADVIVLCMPVHQYRDALTRLAPHINRSKKDVYVGTVYGQAGFNWMVHEMERSFNLTNVVTFAVGLIPWISRTIKYGELGANYGTKAVNVAAVTPPEKFDELDRIFFQDITVRWHKNGRFHQACSFLSLTLSVDNQIIHPSRCYGLWKRYGGMWKSEEDIPFFYKDFDDISAEYIQKMDDDYSKVREAVRKAFPDREFKYMLDYLSLERVSHGKSENDNIKDSFRNSAQLALIKTPTVELDGGAYGLNTNCRFFTDDIPYGVLIARWIGQELGVETPFIDEIIEWVGSIRGEKFLKDGKVDLEYCLSGSHTTGIPPAYGIKSVMDILD
ncbi:hypothetical protein HJC23_000250 [Cyclotella cryptica]|uniref:Opine dehydrogenase domain-containing protein n=1 Tax=Cyclotella cryptica TaxID=29204 RepID=A0ABD3QBD9_9STRA